MERTPMERALSTDQLMDMVLSHLNDQDLLDCRLVSKFWNKAASSVLRKRWAMIKNISTTKALRKLEKCLKQSSDFPFAGLQFAEPWTLRTARATEFFNNYGARFTVLYLGTWWKTRLEDLARIRNYFPGLSILELGGPNSRLPPELWDSAAGQKDAGILNLPSLRTLRIHSSGFNEDVLRQLCTAASPSLQIECLCTSYGILKVLKSAGKLQAVSVMEVSQDWKEEGNKLRVDDLLSTQTPALTKLDFQGGGCISREGLMKLLTSSQHTLKELRLNRICPTKFLSECPVLVKLTSLSVEISYKYPFQGREGHKFPALQELQLGLTYEIDLSDDLFIVPSLKRIHLTEFVRKKSIEALARSFPNVIKIRLDLGPYDFERLSFQRDPADIWSVGAFKKLEKLKIWNYTVLRPTKICDDLDYKIDPNFIKMMNLDSFLTGIPLTICENLRKHNQPNLKGYPVNEILRDSPSLLDLQNLKELIVCVRPAGRLEELLEEPPFISMVSVWYALEMMPNLEAKFVYEPWDIQEEQRDLAVRILKAAFKHVKPHVELERFYY